MSKIPKNLSTEELLNFLETAEDTQNYTRDHKDDLLSEILLFIGHFDIQYGEYKVHQKYVYKLYRAFSKNPVNSRTFLNTFTSIFPHKTNTFYYVNKDVINIIKIIDQYSTKRKIKNSINPKLLNTVKTFLDHKDIKPGGYWVESFILTELYNDYRKKFKQPNYNAKVLTSVLSILFENIKTKHNGFVWIKLNKKALDIFDEVRYTEYINTRGLEWWKNLPDEVAITEANERRKKAKEAIKIQNLKYKTRYKKKRIIAEKKKNIQL
jgi:hypothetical protein